MNSTIELETTQLNSKFRDWPDFHNGVAAGLSIPDDCPFVDSSWVSFNQTMSKDNIVVFDNQHAGFLLGLGLNGYLKKLKAFDIYTYLIAKDNMTSNALSLGLAASYVETNDSQIQKLLGIHVQGMLPPGSAPLDISATTQTISILGLGIVHMGSLNRRMVECMLRELVRDSKSFRGTVFEARPESYTLAAGFSLVSISYTLFVSFLHVLILLLISRVC